MRKIEAQMIMAVRDQLNGSEKTWRSGNTEVTTEHEGIAGTFSYSRFVVVRLHGNEIARFDRVPAALRITDAGWQTVTTKSRLNALLSCFYGGQGIRQVDGVWLLNSTEFAGTDWVSYGWLDNWCCQQAELVGEHHKPLRKVQKDVYDLEMARALKQLNKSPLAVL